MDIYSFFAVALALSSDAFGTALCIGSRKEASTKIKVMLAGSFSLFLFLFTLIGAAAGFLLSTYVTHISPLVGGALIFFAGLLKIRDAMEERDERYSLKPAVILVFALFAGFNAFIIGFTSLYKVSIAGVIMSAAFVGAVALLMSTAAFYLGKNLKKPGQTRKYADYAGGAIFLFCGIKMFFG